MANVQSAVDTANQLLKKNAFIESVMLTKYVRGKSATFDLTPTYALVQFHESLEDKFPIGMIMFQDSGRIFDETPFTGDETLTIKLKSLKTNQTVTRVFDCYSFLPTQPEERNASTSVITVYFRDKNIAKLYGEFSTSFKETLISEFAEQFIKKNFDITNLTVEKTDKKTSMAFPYQKFHYILRYLSNYAKNEKGIGKYMFFSSLFYTYYGTLTNLYKIGLNDGQPIWQYREELPDRSPYHPLLFHSYVERKDFNAERFILDRGAGSTVYTWDPSTKKAKATPSKYSEVYSKNKLESTAFSRFPKTIDAANSLNYYDADDNINQSNEMINQSYHHGISVSFHTTGLLEVTCGVPVKLTFKDYTAKTEKSEFKSGNYLISAIDHYFQKDEYKQEITAVRNYSFVKDSPNQV